MASATKPRVSKRGPGRPSAKDGPAIRARNDQLLAAAENGETVSSLAKRFKIDRKTAREGLREAKARREVLAALPSEESRSFTRREKQEITKAYGNHPEAQEWLERMRKLGLFDPKPEQESGEGQPPETVVPAKKRRIPPDWNGWKAVVKDDDRGFAKIVIPHRRKHLS